MKPRLVLLLALLTPVACGVPTDVATTEPPASVASAPLAPLEGSAACRTPGGEGYLPFDTSPDLDQWILATEHADFAPVAGPGGDHPDMMTLNESGPDAGRFLYRTHETEEDAAVTVTDLETGITRLVVRELRYEALDGLVWTPWGTLLFAEEIVAQRFPEPGYESARRGLVFEFDPTTGITTPRPALGSRPHEGMAVGSDGSVYGVSETRGMSRRGEDGQSGALFRFVPDVPGNLSVGRLMALRVRDADGRTGPADWVELDGTRAQIDADGEAIGVGATAYERPEDIALWTLDDGTDVLFVSITGENRILRITVGKEGTSVGDFVREGLNTPSQGSATFEFPDNVGLDTQGTLWIVEDNGPGDVWVVEGRPEEATARGLRLVASLSDCDAEPTGIYYDRWRDSWYVHVQHAGGIGNDLTVGLKRRVP